MRLGQRLTIGLTVMTVLGFVAIALVLLWLR